MGWDRTGSLGAGAEVGEDREPRFSEERAPGAIWGARDVIGAAGAGWAGSREETGAAPQPKAICPATC